MKTTHLDRNQSVPLISRRTFLCENIAASVAILAGVLLAGCATVPQQELSAYQRTFEQAADTIRLVLLDYQAAVREQRDRETERRRDDVAAGRDDGRPAGLFAIDFQSGAAQVDVAAGDIESRLRAVDTVQHYNQLLVDLAEGKSAKETATTVKSLLGAIPGVGAAVPGMDELAASLVAAVGKARAREDFARVVRAGEKPVSGILDLLAEDAGSFYKLRATLASSDQDEIVFRLTERVSAMKAAVRGHALANNEQREALQELVQGLNALLRRTGKLIDKGREQKFVPATSGALWDETLEGQLKEMRFGVERDVKELEALAKRMHAYHDLLSRYVEVLKSTKRAMGALRVALDSPPDALQQIDQLAATTIQLRAQFLRFRDN